MYANYHTHTVRCNHAQGTERDYIEKAIAQEVRILGFSDHSLQIFPEGYVSGFRMRPDQLEDYVSTLRDLQKEYEDRIRILIGLEAEYYPLLFDDLLAFIEPYDLDYLIMGQHFLCNEFDRKIPCSAETQDEGILRLYVEQTLSGLKTGAFTYFAHPDILRFTGSKAIYEKWYGLLCESAKQMKIPLEINMLGLCTDRHYPSLDFFRLAAEIGNEVILGCDAHEPWRMAVKEELERTYRFIHEAGITNILETVECIKPVRKKSGIK